jgi:N-acetylglucosamine-6-phosphate deacetylase
VSVRLDPHARTDDSTIAGSATDIIEQLRAFEGFRGFNLMPASGQAAAVAAEVLPALRQ